MSLLKKLFFSNKSNTGSPAQFAEGDIFFTTVNSKYYLYKMLVIETAYDGYHVMTYAPIEHKPTINDIENLKVIVYHSPFDRKAFRDAIILTNLPVKSADLIGYHEFLRQTQNPEQYLSIANSYYQSALKLTDNKNHNEAIDAYSKAIDLNPNFFEAIDNRAFCKMDLGLWAEAIKDFELSLNVNSNRMLAEFSMGECFFKMGDFQNAKLQFEKAHRIDPTHQAPIQFLDKLNNKI